VIVTVCPFVILVEFRFISLPDVPTDKLLTITFPEPSLILATAAVPVALAVPLFGTPNIVIAWLASLNDGWLNAIATSTVAYAAVAISRLPAVLASTAVITAVIRVSFSVLE
jgi:hypothetical protein